VWKGEIHVIGGSVFDEESVGMLPLRLKIFIYTMLLTLFILKRWNRNPDIGC
jgi:hypothetical protein